MSPDYDLDPWNRSHPKGHEWKYEDAWGFSHCTICGMVWDGRFGKDRRKEARG